MEKKYYRETEREYDFADGGHYHTDDAIWVIEPTHNRSYQKLTITYFNPMPKIRIPQGDVVVHGRYTEEFTWATDRIRRFMQKHHVYEITKTEAFEALL